MGDLHGLAHLAAQQAVERLAEGLAPDVVQRHLDRAFGIGMAHHHAIDHARRRRMGRPEREAHARDALHAQGAGAERIGEIEVTALADEVEVVVAQEEGEGVGVLALLHHVVRPGGAQHIGPRMGNKARHLPGEEDTIRLRGEGHRASARHHLYPARARPDRPHHDAIPNPMRAEHPERVAVARLQQGVQLGVGDAGWG